MFAPMLYKIIEPSPHFFSRSQW